MSGRTHNGMMTRMNWGYVVAAVAGALIALVGNVIGQTRAERAAAARETRAQAHEREVWARGLRHEVHVEFLTEFDKHNEIVDRAQLRNDGSEPDDDFLLPVWRRFEAVCLIGGSLTVRAGDQAFAALFAHTYRGGPWEDVAHQRDQYVAAVREEFGLPPAPIRGDA